MTEEQNLSFFFHFLKIKTSHQLLRCKDSLLGGTVLYSVCLPETDWVTGRRYQAVFPSSLFETSNLLTSVDTSKYSIFCPRTLLLSKFGCTVIFRLLAGERLPADTPRCCYQCQCTTTGFTASPVGFTADGCYQCQSGWFH